MLANEEAIVREELRSKPADSKLSGEKAFERHKSKTALLNYPQIFFHLSITFLLRVQLCGRLISGLPQAKRKRRPMPRPKKRKGKVKARKVARSK